MRKTRGKKRRKRHQINDICENQQKIRNQQNAQIKLTPQFSRIHFNYETMD